MLVYDNNTISIIKAQNDDREEMENLIKVNNRIDLEHSKKICRQRI